MIPHISALFTELSAGWSLLSPLCTRVVDSLLSGIWQAALLTAAVALTLPVLPRATAALRHFIWMTAFLLFLVLPVVLACHRNPGLTNSGLTGAAVHNGYQLDIRWSFALAALWAILSTWRAVSLARSALRVRRMARRATPVDAVGYPQPAGLSLSRGRRKAVLCVSHQVTGPSVLGFFSPRILIPSSMLAELPTAEIDQIILHEMQHLRRWDDWINLAQKIGLVLFPLHPVLLWIERRLCLERELACDEEVLRITRNAKVYARCLVSLAEHRMLRRPVGLLLGAWERRPQLAHRVHHILRSRPAASKQKNAFASVTLLLASMMTAAIALSRTPQLLSFEAPHSQSGISYASATAAARQIQPGNAYKPGTAYRPGAVYQPVAAYQPVVFHPSSRAGVHYLNAVMNTSPLTRAPHAPVTHRPRTKLHRRVRRALYSQTPQPRLISGLWQTVSFSPPRFDQVVIAVAGDSSYAAVSTGSGWLVIQL
jgi:beta-lactamase regulating signal transducer with metallopeptidase domain